MSHEAIMWLVSGVAVAGMLVLDLGVFHRRAHKVSIREALVWSAVWIALALLFNVGVWKYLGPQPGVEFLTGYLIEKSLSIDNIFVIALLFAYFKVPDRYQHRVLFWGLLGALVMRAAFILAGAALLERFHWIIYLFGAFLILTGIKMLFIAEKETNLAENPALRLLRRHLRVTDRLEGSAFVVNRPDPSTGRTARFFTPLFLALVMIELADIVFAVDSVPAVFAITTDPFIVYTSNIFAILGLRALYFALAAILHRFAYLKQALAILLVFIGSKVFVADMLGLAKFPPALSLAITFAILGAGVGWSLWKTREADQKS